MLKIAIYGKGGIGKSTMTSNLSAAFASLGKRVIQIGCDPKADSTRSLTGTKIRTVLEVLREGPVSDLGDVVTQGRHGVLCVECGGPRPGTGCAGRGIIAAFQELERLGAADVYRPDVVIYDVLGDVVCGGFAMPIRNGYARDVFVVTSGEVMSRYAAGNIAIAVKDLKDDGYARLGGLIQNSRGIKDEDGLVDRTASELDVPVVHRLPRSPTVQLCEESDTTVISGAPDSEMAGEYRQLASKILSMTSDAPGGIRLNRILGSDLQ